METRHDGPKGVTICLDCRDTIATALDRAFPVRRDEAICMACARRRGGVYDEGADFWQTEPRVDDLMEAVERRPD